MSDITVRAKAALEGITPGPWEATYHCGRIWRLGVHPVEYWPRPPIAATREAGRRMNHTNEEN